MKTLQTRTPHTLGGARRGLHALCYRVSAFPAWRQISRLEAIAFLTLLASFASAQSPVLHPLTPVPIQQVVIEDDFWSPKLKVWREVTIPDCFAKFEKDGALANFDEIRDGAGGEHGGPPWCDGLIYEMIRGCADFLASKRDPALEARLDGYIERIAAAAAKDPDGYLNTYTQLKEPGQPQRPRELRSLWSGRPARAATGNHRGPRGARHTALRGPGGCRQRQRPRDYLAAARPSRTAP